MGVVIRQSIKGTIVNYFGAAIGFITTFVILTRYLTSEEIGLARILIDSATLLASLSQLGTNSSVMRFYPYFKDGKGDHGFFFWTVVVPLIGFVLYGLLYLVFDNQISNFFINKSSLFVNYHYWVLPIAFFILYSSVFETNSTVLLRIVVPKLIQEVGVRLMVLAIYLLYAFRLINLDIFVVLFSLVYGVATVLNIVYLFSLKKVSLKPDLKFISKSLRNNYLYYSGFVILIALGNVIMPTLNSFFISAKMGLEFTGIYAVASYISAFVSIPFRSLNAITQPHISAAVKSEDFKEVNSLVKNVSLHQFLIGSLIFFLIWINIDLIFYILPNGDQYLEGKNVVLIMGLVGLMFSTLNVESAVLGYSKFYYYSLFFSLFMTGSAIFLNSVLIKRWGINGAAMASLIAMFLYYFVLILFVIHKLKVSPFSLSQVKVFLIIAVLFCFDYLWGLILKERIISTLSFNEKAVQIIESFIKSGFVLLLAALLVHFFKVSDEISKILTGLLRRLNRIIKNS